MTALAPTLPAGHRTPAHLPWLLRLHRPALYVWATATLVLTGLLVWLGGPLTDAAAEGWRQYNACRDGVRCSYDQDAIVRYKDWYTYTTLALIVLPFAVAAWSGAALIGRELESGTARLAWTQDISPVRWLAVKLTAPAVLVALGTSLLVGLHHWAWSASQGRIDTAKTWYETLTLYANGPITVGFALAGLACGALAGLLSRRTLSALAFALVLSGAIFVPVGRFLPYLWPADTKVSSLENGFVGDGMFVDQGIVTSTGAHIPLPVCPPDDAMNGCKATYAKADAVAFFNDYHPQSHFWPLQLTTTAVLLALAAALTTAAFVLLRRSTATPAQGAGARVREEAAV